MAYDWSKAFRGAQPNCPRRRAVRRRIYGCLLKTGIGPPPQITSGVGASRKKETAAGKDLRRCAEGTLRDPRADSETDGRIPRKGLTTALTNFDLEEQGAFVGANRV